MVVAHHLIWTAYGYWLPNDPRGSTSREILAERLVDLGEIHYGRKRIHPAGWELRQFQEAAKVLLKHEVLKFKPVEVAAIADAFEQVIAKQRYTYYGCAIMPDHIHLLIRKHRHRAEEMIENFQRASRNPVTSCELRLLEHPVWGGPGWKVFLDTPAEIRRVVKYIWNNPLKIGLPEQKWGFVQEYDGWVPGLWR